VKFYRAFDREAEGQGSLYRILPTGEAATSTGVPSTTPPDTVIPPVTDEGEAEGTPAEEDAKDEVNGNNDNNNEEEDQEENNNEN
jgi:hypothetical protein